MRILFTRFPLESAEGGAENQTLWLMDGLRERGHTVHFLGSCPVLLERSANIGIPHQQLMIGDPPVTKSGVVSFLWRKQSMQISLERAMDNLQKANGSFDVVCMLSLTEKLLLTPWCLAHGIRVVWIEHDPVGRWLQWNPWLSILRRLSEKVMTVCVSKMMKEQYYDLGFNEEHLRVIPNGVPPPERVISSLEPLKNMRIGCMARLAPEKGIDTLLFALEGLEGVSLSIIGTGKEEGFLRALLQQDVLRTGEERVILSAHCDDLDAWYASLDVFVLPSRNDPFGLVVAEAMVRGIPVIVSDGCGIADFLHDHDHALLFSADSSSSLRKAILEMQDCVLRKRVAENGQKTAQKHFSLQEMVKRYELLLQSAQSQ